MTELSEHDRARQRTAEVRDVPSGIGRLRSRLVTAVLAAATAILTWPAAHAAPAAEAKIFEGAGKSTKKVGKRRTPPGVDLARPTPAEVAIATARVQLGKPYRWGGTGPASFDCSGLVRFAYAAAGIGLPHNSRAQYRATERVPLDELRPGDLVFSGGGYIHHVGIYVGGGKMVNAPESGRRVEIEPVRGNLIAAGRPAGRG